MGAAARATAALHQVGEDPRAAALATAALHQVGEDPRAAAQAATDALGQARRERDAVAAATARRALGLARRELGDLTGAVDALRAAVRGAARAGAAQAEAEARMSLALVLLDRGRTAAALAQADRAARSLSGTPAARLLAQRGLVLQRAGRHDDALEAYRTALPVLVRAGDVVWQARLRNNRGLLHAYRGAFGAAEADLRRAAELHAASGSALSAADATWNLGWLAARRGEVPAALACFDETEQAYRACGVPAPELLVDRAEVLLGVGLAAEAAALAGRAAALQQQAGQQAALAEARLLQARAALEAGNADAARASAQESLRLLRRQARPGWVLVARHALALAGTGTARRDVAEAVETADALTAAGWSALALDVRLVAARRAQAVGDLACAEEQLRAAAALRSTGVARVRAWEAEARLRLLTGRRRAVESALRAGCRAADASRAALGATELRGSTGAVAAPLAALGVRLALEDGDARRALAWAERERAGALRLRPVRPPDDAALATALADLRAAAAELDQARLEGRPDAAARRALAAREHAVRALTRRAAPGLHAPPVPVVGPDRLRDALGEAALVVHLVTEGRLCAVTVVRGRTALTPLGPVAPVLDELAQVDFGLRRLARRPLPAAVGAATTAAVREGARRLAAALLDPLAGALGDRPLVLVPPAVLHALPWPLLLADGRPVTVAPSATVWHRAAVREPAGLTGAGLLVAGPRLPAAAREVAALARARPDATCLTGERATAERVLAALDGAPWAHLATHGTLRTDNPLLSSLQLADGPLTVYDLERVPRVPPLVVLPVCSSGVGAVRPGEEVLGLSTALLALGARTLVVTVVPVPDEASRALVLALARALGDGQAPAAALARARTALDLADPAQLVAAAGFSCLGAG